MSWRLRWALSQRGLRAAHRRALAQPWKFWAALALKLVPGAWPWPIRLDLRDGGSFAVREFMTLFIYTEIFVHRCYDRALALAVAPRPAIADVGANTGLFALRARQLHPSARVVAFEPLPANHRALRETLAMSGMMDVATRAEGVGGRARIERLYIHPKNIGGHSIVAAAGVGAAHVDIALIDVPQLLDALGGRCDLLKLDCEGAELEILHSLTEREAARIRHIVFEPTAGLYDRDALAARLRSLGYAVRPADGLFIASMPPGAEARDDVPEASLRTG